MDNYLEQLCDIVYRVDNMKVKLTAKNDLKREDY